MDAALDPAGQAVPAPARSVGRGLLRWREHLAAYILIAPALVVLTLYVLVPIGYTGWISFQDVHLGTIPYTGAASTNAAYVNPNAQTTSHYFGLHNWQNLLQHDLVFRMALRNTLVMVLGATVLGALGALLAALLVSVRLPFMGVFRAAYFFPAAISQVVTGLIFLWLFDQNFGLVNHLLGYTGLGPYNWQDDARYILVSLTLAASWLTASYNLPIFAAALQNVPRAQLEAAALDGADAVRTFWHVTLPTLRPVAWFVVISSMVSISQMLGLYDALGQDTIESSTLVKYMFARAFYYNDLDYAGAIGCIMVVSLSALALVQLWLGERKQEP